MIILNREYFLLYCIFVFSLGRPILKSNNLMRWKVQQFHKSDSQQKQWLWNPEISSAQCNISFSSYLSLISESWMHGNTQGYLNHSLGCLRGAAEFFRKHQVSVRWGSGVRCVTDWTIQLSQLELRWFIHVKSWLCRYCYDRQSNFRLCLFLQTWEHSRALINTHPKCWGFV